jgi:BirA family biotin operon repressor/biotin-[acetyl-CoA-carboxylase] ligase
MKELTKAPQPEAPSQSAEPEVYQVNEWTVHHYSVAGSTNLQAANLPAWTAVVADVQTAGRGRFQRRWVSDKGGLWLSAVIPVDSDPTSSGALSLIVGLAVCDSLVESGVSHLRLRWPNDVLVQDRKLAGLLIDRFTASQAVAGIGVNVFNQPEVGDNSLRNQTARLADLVSPAPALFDLATRILRQLRRRVLELSSVGLPSMLERVNGLWGPMRKVELDLNGRLRSGVFAGIDGAGRLRLLDECGTETAYAAHQVRHLQEVQ